MNPIFTTLINRNIITPQDLQGTLPQYDNINSNAGMASNNFASSNMPVTYIPYSPQEVAIQSMQMDTIKALRPKEFNLATATVVGTLCFIGYKVFKSCYWLLGKIPKFRK